MAANRARDAARQLKDDIKNTIHKSRSKERLAPDVTTTSITSTGRSVYHTDYSNRSKRNITKSY